MAGIAEIRSRMRSIEQTMKLTNAMYLISSSKVKKARRQLTDVVPYFDKVAHTVVDIFRHSPQISHRYLMGHPGKREKTTGYVVITGDKGLAGTYNHNVLKLAESHMARKKNPMLFLIGQMGRHYFNKRGTAIDHEFMYTAQDPHIDRAREIVETLLALFNEERVDELYLVYTHSYSPSRMEPRVIKLLPLDKSLVRDAAEHHPKELYREVLHYEPSEEAVMEVLIPALLKGYLFGAMIESFCSEQNARMAAMDTAYDSAGDMLKKLSLSYNRARQGTITQEITEIAGGAMSLLE